MKVMSREDTVREFHRVMGLESDAPMDSKNLGLRTDLICEEFLEFINEVDKAKAYINRGEEVPIKIQEDLLKELSDLQYVISGFAVTYGLPLQAAFNLVHESNMSKVDPKTGKPIFHSNGKILKGPYYKEADLSPLFNNKKEV